MQLFLSAIVASKDWSQISKKRISEGDVSFVWLLSGLVISYRNWPDFFFLFFGYWSGKLPQEAAYYW